MRSLLNANMFITAFAFIALLRRAQLCVFLFTLVLNHVYILLFVGWPSGKNKKKIVPQKTSHKKKMNN